MKSKQTASLVTGLAVLGATFALVDCGKGLNTSTNENTRVPLPPWTGVKLLGIDAKATSGRAIASDSSRNVCAAGSTTGALDGNTMTGNTDFYVTCFDATGTKKWTRQMGTSGTSVSSEGIGFDSSGNVYAIGSSSGDFDGNTGAGTTDMIVVKFDASGNKVWSKQFGTITDDTPGGGGTDGAGNAYVVGYTEGNMDGVKVGSPDFYVTKFDTNGDRQWSRQMGVAGVQSNAVGVAADSSGNVYVAGVTEGNLDGVSKTGTRDAFLVKYDSSGTKQWTRLLGVDGKSTYGNAVALDSSGNAYLAGNSTGSLPGNTLEGTNGVFVARYSPSGTREWVTQRSVAGASTFGSSVSVSSAGAVYVSGRTNGDLGGNTLSGTHDAFIAQLDSSGTTQWIKLLGTSGGELFGSAVVAEPEGGALIAGTTNRGFGGITLSGTTDLFVAMFDSSGTLK